MKNIVSTFIIASLFVFFSCNSNKKITPQNQEKLTSDTIHISNPDLEYDVVIIDAGFSSWFNTFAKPKGFYSQTYMEARNRFWISEWNSRVINALQYGNLYEMQIDYDNSKNYGYHVNYMIYSYLVYFQITNKQKLGGFSARL